MIRALVVALLLAIASVPPTLGAEIDPDRPELTESARFVPRRTAQLEAGLAFSSERRAGLGTEKCFEAEADLIIGLVRCRFVEGDEDDRLTGTVAIDAAVQASLAGPGPDYLVRTGLSVLWR